MITIIDRIYQSSIKFLVPLELKDSASTIVKEAIKLVDAEYGSLFLSHKGKLSIQYSSAPSWSQYEPRREGYTYKAFRSGKVFVLGENIIRKVHPEFKNEKILSFIIIPLYYRGRSSGVLTLQSKRREHFTPDKIRILKLYGAMASLAVTKAQHFTDAKDSLYARDLFMSMASHELKTPITTIYAYAQNINKAIKSQKDVKMEWTEILLKEIVRLTSLIDEFMQIDQIKTRKFQYIFKPWRLKEIIRSAIVNFKSSYPLRVLEVESNYNPDDQVLADYNKLTQVIINILNNAAKFSSSNAPISLRIKANPASFIIQVEDKGRGIPTKDLHKVFKEFYKAEGNEKGGMGLGLYLSRIIVLEHKGKIKITSKEQEGTLVELKLPRIK